MEYISLSKEDINLIPCKKNVIQLINDLRNLMFQGYFNCSLDDDELEDRIKFLLNEELYKAVKLSKKELNVNKIIDDFMSSISLIVSILKTDIEATFNGDPASFDYNEIILSYPGFYAITVYRIAHQLYLLGVPYIPRMMSEYAHSKTGIDIHPGAEIGEYFFIDHGTGIVIGETTIIGKNVKIYQGVTLGALSLGRGQKLKGLKRHPTISDNVTIYSGASILGGDTIIGENVTIGSNTYILESVADNMVVRLNKVDMEIKQKK